MATWSRRRIAVTLLQVQPLVDDQADWQDDSTESGAGRPMAGSRHRFLAFWDHRIC